MSPSHLRLTLVLATATLSLSRVAAADLNQAPPDGQPIPHILSPTGACTSGLNVQACLDDSEISLGGSANTVSAMHNGTVDQQTFDPKCQLTFKVLSKGGSAYAHAFGWYPAKAGNAPPALSDLHVFLNCTDCGTVGTTRTLMVPAGVGSIGFFTASYIGGCGAMNPDGTLGAEPSYTMYTERKFNGRLRNGDPSPMSSPDFIRVIAWQSLAEPGSFYFGWEDDGSTSSDQNFNDLVTRVSGIECSAGGQPCDTGMKGLCAKGTTQCRAGALTCVADQTGMPEKCNAVDDNCDGTVDEGNPCDTGFVCYRGTCVPNCARGEFSCPNGTTCETGAEVCVDVSCKDVMCPSEQVCRSGKCVGECAGIQCPYGQSCRHGACVDVCDSLKCDTGFTCTVSYPGGASTDAVGVCATCGCQGCPTGQTCTNQHCVPNDCASVTCASGTHCQAGTCVDNCAGAMCPPLQKCDKGQCVPDASAVKDAGGAEPPPIIVAPTTGGTTGTTTAGTTGGMGAVGANSKGPAATSGCGCRLPADRPSSAPLLAWIGVALLAFTRRRLV